MMRDPTLDPSSRPARLDESEGAALRKRGQALFRTSNAQGSHARRASGSARPNARFRRQGAAELAHRLAQHAESVCRQYLSNGRRSGGYWHVGDVANTPGQSLYVRLSGSRAGKWCDAATAEHGDLLDLIALARKLPSLKHALAEARQFLDGAVELPAPRAEPGTSDKTRAAQRLFGNGRSIDGTLVETYLAHRGITGLGPCPALRFHPTCYYRDAASLERRPALLAAITDLDGRITGIQRTWLDLSGRGKAPVTTPRRALGRQFGNGVRFGNTRQVMLAGEGIETVLSLGMILPEVPMVAALSASNLGALVLPQGLQRLYVARDRDTAGRSAFERLARRASGLGVTVYPLDPVGGDFNDDLVRFGAMGLRRVVAPQLVDEDVAPFTA
jgi:Toprim domain